MANALPDNGVISVDDIATPAPQSGVISSDDIATPAKTPEPQKAADAAQTISPDDIASNNTQEEHGMLSNWVSKIKSAVAGPGTFLGTPSGETLGDLPGQSIGETIRKTKEGVEKLLDTSAIVPYNAADPDFEKNHPHVAAASRGLSDAIKSLSTPGSIATILGTSGMGELPAALEKALGATDVTKPYAAVAAKVARRSLQALGAYFTISQIEEGLKQSAEATQAVLSGDTDKAIELFTGALVNGGMGYMAGKHTVNDINNYRTELRDASALKDKDYIDEVTRRGNDFSVAGGTQDMVKQIAAKPGWQDATKRQAASHYIEANGDKDVLAKRQAEAIAGPRPIAGDQGEQAPIEDAKKPVETNGSGESAASQEAINRVASEKTKGVQRYRVDTRSGIEIPIANTADAVDIKAQPFEEIRQRGPEGDILLDRGDKAKPFVPKPAVSESVSEKESGVHDLGDISEKPEPKLPKNLAGSKPRYGYRDNNYSLDFASDIDKALYTVAQSAPNAAHDRFVSFLQNQFPGTSEADIVKMGKQVRDNIKAIAKNGEGEETISIPKQGIVPPSPKPIFTTDANGTRWAKVPDAPAVSIPTDMTDAAEIQKYAEQKIQLQRDFLKNRASSPLAPAGLAETALGESKATAAPSAEENPASAEPTLEDIEDPASQKILEIKAALEDAKRVAAAHAITPEERAAHVEKLDPNRQFSPEDLKDLETTRGIVRRLGEAAVERGILKPAQLRGNFVPHEFPFDDRTDPTRARLHDTLHDAFQAGLVSSNDDYFALAHDYIGKMTRRINDFDTVQNLKNGKTNTGAPLAVPGGFVEGQRVATKGPQSYTIEKPELQNLVKTGQLPGLIREGRVTQNPDKTFTMNANDYKEADNLHELRPIGRTPIPASVLKSLQEDGTLDELEVKKLVFKNSKGQYFNTEPLYAKTPVYVHPDQAAHLNQSLIPKSPSINGFFGKAGKLYDDATGNMKSLLLSWSPFHKLTEDERIMQGMGAKGAGVAANYHLGKLPDIDYTNLTPTQAAAIRDGITNGTDVRGASESLVGEGVGAGGEKNWGAKTYKIFNNTLEALRVPKEIRDKIDPEKVLTQNVFGPNGQITKFKMAFYEDKKPQIVEQMVKDHPDWPKEEIDVQAGRLAAQFANNLFGGQNLPLIGRTAQDQKWMRRILLAPDFLESTARSIPDLGNKYGADLAAKFIQFNLAHAAIAASINYAIHHDPDDHSVKGALDASHILDHPLEVISRDGKTVYGLRTVAEDFNHFLDKPREFTYDRVNPFLRASDEAITKRNQYGRAETQVEALKAFPKATLPIQIQNAVGLGPNTTTEPSWKDQAAKSLGIQARPNRTPAEQLAIDKVSAKLQGQSAREGQDLLKQQMKFNMEDKLRDANAVKDPDKKKAAIASAMHDLDMLKTRKIISPAERQNIVVDAKGSRLKSTFVHMDPSDALDVWDKANDAEKEELGAAMQAHWGRWRESLYNKGERADSLNEQNQKLNDRFKAASSQYQQIRSRLQEDDGVVSLDDIQEKK